MGAAMGAATALLCPDRSDRCSHDEACPNTGHVIVTFPCRIGSFDGVPNMKRRGNKSNKVCGLQKSFSSRLTARIQVPNVKLRPAQSAEPSTREPDSFCWAEDSQRFNDTVVDLCPRPFKGVVLCATGIADKARVSSL